ncbi:MAG: sulfur oxidation c-type cytochrome SoxA [Epsilonproteobacteria bacterium]|nr:sulfur oxidation c-type cytochrome SoxA [Campylobacterota bacterium]
MIGKILKISAASIAAISFVNAQSFDAQAKKDQEALIKYFLKKFKDPAKHPEFFPYTPKEELEKNFYKNLKFEDFRLGSYAYAKSSRAQYEEIVEMPPYEDAIDEGEELYKNYKFKDGKGFKDCFKDPAIRGEYPKFDTKKNEVVTLSVAINNCLKAHGEKPWNLYKGKMAKLKAYFAAASKEAKKKINIKIPTKEAAQAYERGKEIYYSQRGYLKLSCANCHVQGSGSRVRAEYLSPLLGAVTHFPVYRLKWQGVGTIERRIKGCEKNQGEKPHKGDSKWVRELIYFMTYMSNNLPVDGPDVRK